ncbi:cytochrome P450 27C1-like [Dendronephthya gigantea]|uniref:cytochrome P450 27C1-like n=1 Tax=Dendronephthya gigantea TaxID=151771 RepID=UPI00106D7CC6|nr:cytochrome P450 27C1-like [Dendronephthya gigantea]
MALLHSSFTRNFHFRRSFRLSRSLTIKEKRLPSFSTSSTDNKVLPFADIPGPRGTFQNIPDYVSNKGAILEVAAKRFERFGPIYSEKLLSEQNVNICDADAIQKVLSSEKKFQMRPGFDALAEIIEGDNGLGFASNDYEIWHQDRSRISPKLMRPKEIMETFPILNTVANDFTKRLDQLRKSDGVVDNIHEELTYFMVESFSSFLFNRRLGFYNHPPEPAAVAFVNAALDMIYNIGMLFYTFPLNKYIRTPPYYRLKKNLATIHTLGMDIIDEVFATKQQEREKEFSNNQSVFEYLVENGMNTPKSLAAMAGLLAAGVDTTSITSLWLLYELSRNPDFQDKVYQEIASAVGPNAEVSANNVPSLLKAALKESQRMYPVAGYIVPRVFPKDLEVLGYNIPAGVNVFLHEYLLSLDERYYGQDAKQFVPERWLRDETGEKKEFHPFTTLPFGYGVRMCVGRRMAVSTIYTLVSKILLRYRLEYAGETEANPTVHAGIMKPDGVVLMKFIPREMKII